MAAAIEDYGLVGDTQAAGLVSRRGSLDWLCLPRFDSGACFAALLGTSEHGRWLLAPRGEHRPLGRSYRGDTLILETELETASGRVRLIDFMPPRGRAPGDAPRSDRPLRLRLDRALGTPCRRPLDRDRGAGRPLSADTGRWDYRICWLRDATLTLVALVRSGYTDEARAWREWLLRSIAGDPADLQVMYGPAGERRLPELELGWLPGHERSTPVRVGNAASGQLQLDVYGEVINCLYQTREHGLQPVEPAWDLQIALLDYLESGWRQEDEGIWEVRGPRRHFTHSKVMSWVAFDRAVRSVERHGLDGSVDRWKRRRAEIHDEVCRKAYAPELGAFVQSYGSREPDAALLMIPLHPRRARQHRARAGRAWGRRPRRAAES